MDASCLPVVPICLYAVVSGNVEVLRFLIQRSTWLDAADGADDTALHIAARCVCMRDLAPDV
jgi:hypothetical protein